MEQYLFALFWGGYSAFGPDSQFACRPCQCTYKYFQLFIYTYLCICIGWLMHPATSHWVTHSTSSQMCLSQMRASGFLQNNNYEVDQLTNWPINQLMWWKEKGNFSRGKSFVVFKHTIPNVLLLHLFIYFDECFQIKVVYHIWKGFLTQRHNPIHCHHPHWRHFSLSEFRVGTKESRSSQFQPG